MLSDFHTVLKLVDNEGRNYIWVRDSIFLHSASDLVCEVAESLQIEVFENYFAALPVPRGDSGKKEMSLFCLTLQPASTV